MPQEQTTTYTVTEDGDLQGRTAGQDLITWLSNVLELFAGGRVEITVSRPTRSLRQNRAYWRLLTEVAQGMHRAGVTELHMVSPGTGEVISLPVNKDLLHKLFKNKYLVAEEGHDQPSTTRLDKTEMTRYMDKIMEDPEVRELDISFREQDEIHDHPR